MSSLDKHVYALVVFFLDGGRELSFPAYYFFAEKRLVNHTLISVPVKDLDECEYRCYLIANCVSLNIKNKDPISGTHDCELNNSTHLEDDGDLKDNQLYYYRGAEVSNNELPLTFHPEVLCQTVYYHRETQLTNAPGLKKLWELESLEPETGSGGIRLKHMQVIPPGRGRGRKGEGCCLNKENEREERKAG